MCRTSPAAETVLGATWAASALLAAGASVWSCYLWHSDLLLRRRALQLDALRAVADICERLVDVATRVCATVMLHSRLEPR